MPKGETLQFGALSDKAKHVINGLNRGFNKVADFAEQTERISGQDYTNARRQFPFNEKDNIAAGIGKASVRTAAGAFHGGIIVECGLMKSVAEAGAKITGGRKTTPK